MTSPGSGVNLVRHSENRFTLAFTVDGHPGAHEGLRGSMFAILGALSPDVVEAWGRTGAAPGTVRTFLLFRDFCPDAGLPRAYLHVEEETECGSTGVSTSRSVPLEQAPEREWVEDSAAVLIPRGTLGIQAANKTATRISYEFSTNHEKCVPELLKRLPLLMMKRLMGRLKRFMDNSGGVVYASALGDLRNHVEDGVRSSEIQDWARQPPRDARSDSCVHDS